MPKESHSVTRGNDVPSLLAGRASVKGAPRGDEGKEISPEEAPKKLNLRARGERQEKEKGGA